MLLGLLLVPLIIGNAPRCWSWHPMIHSEPLQTERPAENSRSTSTLEKSWTIAFLESLGTKLHTNSQISHAKSAPGSTHHLPNVKVWSQMATRRPNFQALTLCALFCHLPIVRDSNQYALWRCCIRTQKPTSANQLSKFHGVGKGLVILWLMFSAKNDLFLCSIGNPHV